jgi:hypothetical protein
VEDLAVVSVASGDVTLTWTAPGDDGMEGRAARYDLRYAGWELTEATWDSAQGVVVPVPRAAGEAETLLVKGLGSGRWFFGLKAADEVPNWSALSNVVEVEVSGDTVPPARVEDLRVVEVGIRSVRLEWTAPGDDGMEGRASEYVFGYGEDSLEVAMWGDVERVGGLVPGLGGGRDWYEVAGLRPGRRYYFGLRARDEAGNWSEVSNVVSATTEAFQQLTYSSRPLGAQRPDWSPDGSTIVFDADWKRQFRPELYVVPADGGQPQRIADDPDGAWRPRWSPEGTRLAYVDIREMPDGAWYDLCLVSTLPGSAPEVLVPGERALQPIYDLAWSPDGSRIAYVLSVSWTPPLPPATEIRIVPVQGGQPQTLVAKDGILALSWSPDGSSIWFDAGDFLEGDLWKVVLPGGELVQMTSGLGDERAPLVSPDGERVIFYSDQSGSPELWLIPAEGGEMTQVTHMGKKLAPGAWSPDGRGVVLAIWEEFGDIAVLWLE